MTKSEKLCFWPLVVVMIGAVFCDQQRLQGKGMMVLPWYDVALVLLACIVAVWCGLGLTWCCINLLEKSLKLLGLVPRG